MAFVAVAMLSTVFSGCVELLRESPGADASATSIAKKIEWIVDDDTIDSDASFEDMVKTRLEYTHRGSAVPASGLVFAYQNDKGVHKETPGNQLTGAQEVRDGDIVIIANVNITSGLVVRHGAETLAKRGNMDDKWFRAGGVPIPMRSSEAGLAQYDIDSSAGLKFDASGITADDMVVHTALANIQGKVTGPLTIKTLMPGGAPRIELSADLDADLEMLLEADITEAGSRYQAGMQLKDFVGELEGLGTLQFSATGGFKELTHTGDSGRLFVDGKVHLWDQEHPKSSNYEPEDIEHPMVDVREEYSEEPVGEPDDVEAWVADFLSKLWSMDVAVGDDYRFHFEHDGDSGDVEFDYIIQIVGEESRDVGGRSMPAYRVSQLAKLVIDFPNGVDATFDVVRGNYWVSKDSYLPIYAQISSSRSFNHADAEQFLRAMGEEIPYELPEELTLVLSGEQILRLTSYSGDFTIAPIVGVLLGNSGSYGFLGAPSMFLMMSGAGAIGDSYEYEPPEAPSMSFGMDELNDRLTVTAVQSHADWSELAARVLTFQDAEVYVTPTIGGMQRERVHVQFYGSDPLSWDSVPVVVGDYLTFCADTSIASDLEIEILHDPTYMPIHTTMFVTIGPCT